jgi:hypothetical protein
MNQLMMKFHRIFTIFLAGVLFFISSISSVDSAFAKPLTPEAAAYEIDNADNVKEAGDRLKSQAREHKQELRDGTADVTKAAKNVAKEAPNKAGGMMDTIREKLNLDEPIPESTKEFLDNPIESFQEEGQYPQENVDNTPFQGQD